MFRRVLFSGMMLLAASATSAQTARPPVGGVGSPAEWVRLRIVTP